MTAAELVRGARTQSESQGKARNSFRHAAGAVPGRTRPDDCGRGSAAHRHRSARRHPVHVGDHDLPADLDDQRADLRQALRPVWSAADHPVCDQPVHRRVGSRRAEPGDVAVRRRTRPSGPGRAERSSRSPSPRSPTFTRRPSGASTQAISVPSSASRRSLARPLAASSPTTLAGTGSSWSTCPSASSHCS